RPFSHAYFRAGVACPFLEEESCSIHPDRPLACREYLVTSPAENCSHPTEETVHMIPIPSGGGKAVRALDRQTSPGRAGWVPLILALEWAETHPEEPAALTGPQLLEEFFKRLTGK